MRRIRTVGRTVFGVIVVAGGLMVLAPAAHAITIPVACSENALIAAVNLANATAAADTLVLAGGCTYALTSPHGGLTNGLPVITTPIEMIGPATITRNSLLLFRIIEVSATGNLTLTTSVAITNGSVIAAINSTATTLTQTAVTANRALLTAGGVYRQGGTMTTTNSPITANTPNNCVGSTPAVPNCTG